MAVDVVAVDVNPTVWGAYCEECDLYVGKFSSDSQEQEGIAQQHQHNSHTS
jgi:hypothetical protein